MRNNLDIVSRFVRDSRARVRLRRVIDAACVAGGGATSVVFIASLTWPATSMRWWAAAVGLAVLATTAGVLFGLITTPSAATVAARADRTLQLRDRLLTAYERRYANDRMTELVLRDAAMHLNDVAAAHVFTLQIGRNARAAIVAAFVCILLRYMVLALATALPSTTAGPTSRVQPATAPQAALSRNVVTTSLSNALGMADPAVASTPVAKPPALQTSQPSTEQPTASSNDNTPPTNDRTANAPGNTKPLTRAADRSPRAPSPGGPAGTAGGKHAQGAANQGVSTPANDLRAPRVPTQSDYSRAWRLSEEALAPEQIPEGLRQYIRNYFLAIQADRGTPPWNQ